MSPLFNKHILALVAALTMATAATGQQISPKAQAIQQNSIHRIVIKDSPEYRQIADFLARTISRNSARLPYVGTADANSFGDSFTVSYTHVTQTASSNRYSTATITPPPPPPPWTPGTSGNSPGDTASVSTCNALTHTTQTWKLVWVKLDNYGAGYWEITDYHSQNTTSCGKQE